jgi:glycosyltransferase involved in cell wall biosynthesis
MSASNTRTHSVLLLSNRPIESGMGVYSAMLEEALVDLGVQCDSYHWEGRLVERMYTLLWRRFRRTPLWFPLSYFNLAMRLVSHALFFRQVPRGRELYHVTNAALASAARDRRPWVVTVHDMIPFLNPRHTSDRFIKRSMNDIRMADAVICISEELRKEVLAHTNVQPQKAFVVHNGVNHRLFHPRDKQEARRALGLPAAATIVLHVGSEEMRKNVPILLKAFHRLVANEPNALLLRVGEATPESAALIRSLGLGDRVRYLHGLTQTPGSDAVGLVYNASDVLAFPSAYEPFGLPPLEAMASGCPVVASNLSAIPEVVGDAGALVDPNNAYALADALSKVLSEKSYRDDLVAKGIVRAAEFSWERCARETLAVYQQVVPGLSPLLTP